MADDTLAEITSAATSLSPVLGSVGEAAKFGTAVIGLFSQPLKSAQLDKPTNEAQDRIQAYEQIINEPESQLESDLGPFLSGMCLKANLPIGELSGRTRRVPVEFVTAFVTGINNLIQLREQEQATAAEAATNK